MTRLNKSLLNDFKYVDLDYLNSRLITSGNNGFCLQATGSLNNLTNTGFYYNYSPTDQPSGTGNGYIIVMKFTTTYIMQMFIPYGSASIYIRHKSENGWGVWAKV